MNIKNLSAAVSAIVLFGVAGAALAGAPNPNSDDTQFVSTKTRAEVIAELQQARANGEILNNDNYPGPVVTVASSTKTRAQVIAELKEYQQTHANPSYGDLVFVR